MGVCERLEMASSTYLSLEVAIRTQDEDIDLTAIEANG